MAKRRCTAKTKQGKRCRNGPVARHEQCIAHLPRTVKDSLGFGGPQEGSGPPRLPRPHEELRRRIEQDIDRWLAPLEAALSTSKPVVMWDQAEGRHRIELVSDPELGMKAMKLAFDRVYGRPRQQVELTGEDGGAVRISEETFADPKIREGLHELVRRVGAARAG